MIRERISLGLMAGLALAVACGGGDIEQDSARFAADTGMTPAAPATAGPLPPVASAADADLVMAATELEITDENFERFARASEALSYLRARDLQVRTMLEQVGTTADTAAGSMLERLEQHPQVSQAITNTGMSVRDYYVTAIALANARRHADDPRTAPPTPVGRKNAEWARANSARLARLQTWGAAVAQ